MGQIIRSRYLNSDPLSSWSMIKQVTEKNNAGEFAWLQNVNNSIVTNHNKIANFSKTKIMVIGSSQTAGEGSALENEDFVSQFSSLVNNNLPSSKDKFEVINAGFSGQPIKTMLAYFRYQLLQFEPSMVIVNASSNDNSYATGDDFSIALEDFIYLSKKYNFELVFVAEANSVESGKKIANHKIMRDLAEKNEITFINMHEYLADQQNNGIIWWDFVHPTSFGYKLIANHLFDSLKPQLLELN
jgi:lysophospholipase L1-like esterase